MPVRAGELNRRLKLQTVVMVVDAEGTSVEQWRDIDTLWAHIQPTGGSELPVAAQTAEKITHQITIRYRTDLSPVKMRFLFPSVRQDTPDRLFNIHMLIDPDGMHEQLNCLCEEFVIQTLGAQ